MVPQASLTWVPHLTCTTNLVMVHPASLPMVMDTQDTNRDQDMEVPDLMDQVPMVPDQEDTLATHHRVLQDSIIIAQDGMDPTLLQVAREVHHHQDHLLQEQGWEHLLVDHLDTEDTDHPTLVLLLPTTMVPAILPMVQDTHPQVTLVSIHPEQVDPVVTSTVRVTMIRDRSQ